MEALGRLGRSSLKLRYLVLLAVVLVSAHEGYLKSSHNANDWVIFEVGARVLTHYRGIAIYGGNPLHLYANLPIVQVGPPALLPVIATEWMSPHTVNVLWVVLMALMGIASIAFVEAAAARVTAPVSAGVSAGVGAVRRRAIVFALGLPISIAWGYEVGEYHHLDDAMAMLLLCLVLWLIATGRSAWLIGIALGVAVAAKPWAIVMAPVLIGLPRTGRAKACLALIVSAAAFWAPFVIAAPQTVSALGSFLIVPRPGSILYLFGLHGQVQGWLRSAQFASGVAVATYVAVRGRWAAAPLAGLAVRVAFDPYIYSYYGLGPVLAALAWDLMRPAQRRLPLWTIWTVVIEFGLHLVAPPTVCAIGRLAWVLSVLVVIVRAPRVVPEPSDEPGTDSITAEPAYAA
ncbi:MAG TPA: hypothetical protein VME70_16415 [Mycobacteriales bacterium]|nr:hypothetical protein [Mycobacteriales bacterium]